jgi:hypothetical protein
MNDAAVAEKELVREGLTSYWDATYAIACFEKKIQSTAREVMKAHLSDIKDAMGAEQLVSEETLYIVIQECQFYRVIIGSGYRWDPGLQVGIGWAEVGTQPIAICSIPNNAAYRAEFVLNALRKGAENLRRDGVQFRLSPGYPYHVVAWLPLTLEMPIEDIQSRMNDVLSAVIECSKAAGGLLSVTRPESQKLAQPQVSDLSESPISAPSSG